MTKTPFNYDTLHIAVEDVFLTSDGELAGPTVSRNWKDETITIRFNRDTKAWLHGAHSNRKIIHSKYATIGEANRGRLHELLDSFIDDVADNTESRSFSYSS